MTPELDLGARWSQEWYERSTLVVARALLGCVLVHATREGVSAGRIVETEAYLGPYDRAAHSYGGRMTRRNAPMFEERGRAYVYFIYGMHWCFNVVTGPPGKPQAVLIRALEAVDGEDLMRGRIGRPHEPASALCRGPGKLCKALGITGALNRDDLAGDRLYIVPGRRRRGETVVQSPRIGIGFALGDVDRLWRFSIAGNACVSRPPRAGGVSPGAGRSAAIRSR